MKKNAIFAYKMWQHIKIQQKKKNKQKKQINKNFVHF